MFATTSLSVLRRVLPALLLMAVLSSIAAGAEPGLAYPAGSAVNDQKAGSILVYNLYSSSPTNPAVLNTRFNLTNTHDTRGIFVHLFFIEGASCSVIDRFICLSESQTMQFSALDQDPGTTGYLIAAATDFNGVPTNFNYLIGDEAVKLDTGHFANLAAESISAIAPQPAQINPDQSLAGLVFDDVAYNRLPAVLAASNIPSRADGNDTVIVINSILALSTEGLSIRANAIGAMFGILYDDQEQPHSFNANAACQVLLRLSFSFPKTVPRFEVVIPAGQTGWLKIWGTQMPAPILGAMINYNQNASASASRFNSGHNLHKLRLENRAPARITVPIFPPGC
ncbi:MAG: hypothetical protein ABI882_05510 [Acidobacteriota bacterium]